MSNTANALDVDLNVLVIDDNTQILDLVQGALRAIGITKIIAVTAVEPILPMFPTNAVPIIDLIICDWNLPTLSGLEFLRLVRVGSPRLAFIMLTGNADEGSVKSAMKHGATDYIVKPFAATTLQKKVTILAKLIAHRRAQEMARRVV